jgi:nucleotide-binding universal stress UspA family protein
MKGIVVGIDRSVASGAALEWALAEGVRTGRPVNAVRAWVDPVTAGYPLGTVLQGASEQVGAAALASVEEALKEAAEAVLSADGVETHAAALRGAAAAVLEQLSHEADLLVVGTRSHGALSRAVLGSVSAAVLHHASCPVVVVPEPRPAGSRPPRVVVGVDHSVPSLAALHWAARHAARRDVVIAPMLVREPAWSVEAPPGQMSASLAQLEENERQALRAALPRDLADTLRVEPEVLAGHAGATLLEQVEPQDLLVVGTRGRGGFAGLLLGSTSMSVAQHAPCPVAVLREGMTY